MKLKRGMLLLCSLVAIGAVGLGVKSRLDRYMRIRATFPPAVDLVLDKSEKFYLYSLQSERLPNSDLRTLPNFHGYPISGQVRVRPTPERADLLAALRTGIGRRADCDCFNPHYGVRVVRGNKTVDLLIGFKCEDMRVYGDHGVHEISVPFKAQEAFNHILAEYDVPLPVQ